MVMDVASQASNRIVCQRFRSAVEKLPSFFFLFFLGRGTNGLAKSIDCSFDRAQV